MENTKVAILNETYILGSGASLNTLTSEEIEHINKANLVISFNKYLIFYDKIGIVPHIHLQFDAANKQSYYVFLKTISKILYDKKLRFIYLGLNTILLKKAQFYLPAGNLFPIYDNSHLWKEPNFKDQIWARSLTQKMFHFRGSLTSVINLANIINPTSIIKLVGVDMGSNEYFFQHDYEADSYFHDWTYTLMKNTGVHSNICYNAEFGGISQEVCIDFIRRKVRETGGDLVTVNSMSYYAQKGILDVVTICNNTTGKNFFILTDFFKKNNAIVSNNTYPLIKLLLAKFRIGMEILLHRLSATNHE